MPRLLTSTVSFVCTRGCYESACDEATTEFLRFQLGHDEYSGSLDIQKVYPLRIRITKLSTASIFCCGNAAVRSIRRRLHLHPRHSQSRREQKLAAKMYLRDIVAPTVSDRSLFPRLSRIILWMRKHCVSWLSRLDCLDFLRSLPWATSDTEHVIFACSFLRGRLQEGFNIARVVFGCTNLQYEVTSREPIGGSIWACRLCLDYGRIGKFEVSNLLWNLGFWVGLDQRLVSWTILRISS